MKQKRQAKPAIAHAIIWAGLMLATALMLNGTGVSGEKLSMLIMFQIAGWFATSQLLPKATETE